MRIAEMQKNPSFEVSGTDANEVSPEGPTSRTPASHRWVGSHFPPTGSTLIPRGMYFSQYSFPLAAETNYHEPSGFKRYTSLFSFRSVDQKSDMGLIGLKSGC